MVEQSPQRRRWVTWPEEIEPRPGEFSIQVNYRPGTGILEGFTVQDPDGTVIRKRADLINAIHLRHSKEVTLEQLKDSSISYYDYYAVVEMRR